ncbi:protein translocase subunit SecF [Candidatus Pacearchaeota archaeon]|nr:protein translocase subunit SecF [Candidatus Pacearchaeota archaeon]
MEVNQKNWYDRSYKILLFIPIALLLVAFVYLFIFYQQEGDFIRKDVSLTGGTTITVLDGSTDVADIEDTLKTEFPDAQVRSISDIRSGKQQGFFIETKADSDVLKSALENYLGYALTSENSSIEFSGSTLSQGFYKQLRLAMIIAFALMALVVFVIFRTFIPSIAVIFAGFADIVMTVATVNLIGLEMSSAGIVALLMLIGYSVDTDILLTSRVLKNREGSVNERIYGAFKTGMTMTITAIAAVGVSFIIIYNFSDTFRQIFGIILIGLGYDIINTWMTNASILKWYAEAKRL